MENKRITISKFFAMSLLSLILAACISSPDPVVKSTLANSTQVDLTQIKAHMGFLADDLLEGRDTGSRGHEIASLYIQNEFKKYGLLPAGDDGTFQQRVEFRRTSLDQSSPQLRIVGDPTVELSFPDGFIVSADPSKVTSHAKAELVFVSYGLVAQELEIDDYAGLDVEGKIVIVLMGRPADLPSDIGASMASLAAKRETATSRGAIGMLMLQTPQTEESRPYTSFLSFIQAPRLTWLDKQGTPNDRGAGMQANGLLSIESGKKIFAAANQDLTLIFEKLANDEKVQGFALGIEAELAYQSAHESIYSPNVVGLLPGSDPTLANEYVVYTAHSDHIGVSKSVEKDKINNGAIDNASGTAILIETARTFASLPTPPKRSILFVALTGEERGLLGADYFVNFPTVDGELVANVNLDTPLLTFEFADVIAFGAEHSTMGVSVEQAVTNAKMKLTADPWPELNLFTRSDHYAFVRKGIPAVFLVSGIESRTDGIDGSTVLQTFLSTHYHRPSDDMNQPFVWPAAEKFTRVNFEIGLILANQAVKPAWYSDSYFGKTFGRDNLVERAGQ